MISSRVTVMCSSWSVEGTQGPSPGPPNGWTCNLNLRTGRSSRRLVVLTLRSLHGPLDCGQLLVEPHAEVTSSEPTRSYACPHDTAKAFPDTRKYSAIRALVWIEEVLTGRRFGVVVAGAVLGLAALAPAAMASGGVNSGGVNSGGGG